jgi:hypothetical protein
MVNETIEDVFAVSVAGGDWVRPSRRGILFCTVAGNVAVQWPNGVTTTKALTVGEYWRVAPAKVLQAGTTATVQYHV